EDFDLFHPDRLAGRILGEGDIATLIEKAETAFEQEQAEAAAARLLEGTFTLDDFLDQMQAIKKMGPISGIMGMLPGVPKEVRDVEIEDRQIDRIEAIIRSMTPGERVDPDLVDGSRRTRIARGSGTSSAEVGQLLAQFKQMRQMMQQMGRTPNRKKKRKGNKKAGKGGGRVTAKGPAPVNKAAFTLPTMDEMQAQLPDHGGFPKFD
ncbi:MAG: signal recognition particle protein, partial [Actinomycetes bacterium]